MTSKMNGLASLFFSVLCLASIGDARRRLPKFVKTCSRSDSKAEQCLKDAVNNLMPYLVKGIPQMGVPSIDPMLVSVINFETEESKQFAFVANISDAVITGSGQAQVIRTKIEKDNFEVEVYIPTLNISGHYEAVGKVLLLKIDGEGEMELNATKVTLTMKMFGERYMKRKTEHYRTDRIDVDLKVTGLITTYFENLIPDPVANEQTNMIISANSIAFYEELRPLVGNAIGAVAKNIYNQIHSRFSNKVLYPEENDKVPEDNKPEVKKPEDKKPAEIIPEEKVKEEKNKKNEETAEVDKDKAAEKTSKVEKTEEKIKEETPKPTEETTKDEVAKATEEKVKTPEEKSKTSEEKKETIEEKKTK